MILFCVSGIMAHDSFEIGRCELLKEIITSKKLGM